MTEGAAFILLIIESSCGRDTGFLCPVSVVMSAISVLGSQFWALWMLSAICERHRWRCDPNLDRNFYVLLVCFGWSSCEVNNCRGIFSLLVQGKSYILSPKRRTIRPWDRNRAHFMSYKNKWVFIIIILIFLFFLQWSKVVECLFYFARSVTFWYSKLLYM